MTETGAMLAAVGAREGIFASEFTHSLDGKRRITIPAIWREVVGHPPEVFVMPSLTADCVAVYPMRVMAPRISKAREVSMTNRDGQMFLRMLASQSEVLGWDVQGRIRVKDELLKLAGIGDDVTLVGKVDGFELWCPARLAQVKADLPPSALKDGATSVGW